MAEMQFHLPDMSCGHCVASVTETVKGLDTAAELDFAREERRITVRSDVLEREQLVDALTAAGYPPG